MGKKATLYLDATGKVAYAESEAGSAKNYAYLLRAVKRQYAGRDTVMVKVFNKDGKMLDLRLYSSLSSAFLVLFCIFA